MAIDLTPPASVRASYQKDHYATGTYTQGGSQVFSHLVTPPSTGVAAETASDADAHAVGAVTDPDANDALLDTTRQRDGMRNAADSASGDAHRDRPAPG